MLAGAIALRWFRIGHESLWFDEAYSIQLASQPINRILAERAVDIHPPLYYLLLHGWLGIAGTSEAAARALSAVCDLAAIGAAAMVARRLVGPAAALVTCLLLALSPLHVAYAQEARMYALLVLLATLSVGTWIGCLERGAARHGVAFAATTVLLLYTHAHGMFVVAAELTASLGLLAFYPAIRRDRWRVLLASLLAVVLLYMPWLATLGDQFARVQAAFWVDRPGWDAVLDPGLAFSGSTSLLAILSGLAAAGLWALTRHPPLDRAGALPPWLVLLPWLLVPTLTPWAISQVSAPIFLPKYTIAASVPWAILVACGIVALPSRAWRLGALVLIGGLLVPVHLAYFGTPHKDGWRRAAARLETQARAGDLALFYPWYNEVPYAYYRRRDDVIRRPFVPDIHALVPSPAEIPALVSRISPHPRLFFVTLQGTPQRDAIVAELTRAMRLTSHTVEQHVEIFEFEAR